MVIEAELTRIREWAQEKAQSGCEPPWAWYQYMKLIEASNAILAGMESTTPTESSPRAAERSGKLIQLTAPKCSQDTVQRHSDTGVVPLPM